ncbi:hypothetical protein [Methylobacterium crusticola]|nr:hypothetical protein [Methylobacterium crusticola]
MNLDQFRASLRDAAPSPALAAPLAALWWAGRGADPQGWERAHALVQEEPGADAAWVHAHLHRVEGDAANARYWYRRAQRPAAEGALEAEWDAIAGALLGRA